VGRTTDAGDYESREGGIGGDDERGEEPEVLSVEEKTVCGAEPPPPSSRTKLHHEKQGTGRALGLRLGFGEGAVTYEAGNGRHIGLGPRFTTPTLREPEKLEECVTPCKSVLGSVRFVRKRHCFDIVWHKDPTTHPTPDPRPERYPSII
jgi:hypothetical protein